VASVDSKFYPMAIELTAGSLLNSRSVQCAASRLDDSASLKRVGSQPSKRITDRAKGGLLLSRMFRVTHSASN